MKHMKTLLPAILLCLLASSCSFISNSLTETYYRLDNPIPVRADEVIDTLCTLNYSVDGKLSHTVIRDQRNLDFFIYSMLAQTERGSVIQIETTSGVQSSERKAFNTDDKPIIFTTTDSNRAKEWVKKMLLNGYKVSIVYDRKEKIYTCTAYQSK